MRTVGQFPNVVREVENRWITLMDGCRLAARLWLPADAQDRPVPAILEYVPYRKRDGTAVRDELIHPYLAGHGYACVRVDLRGSGESDGLMADEYSARELADGKEVVEWIAAQPWCDGKVGMMGISWGGFNALQVAALRPAPLKAIVTLCSTDDRYADDIHYAGGCLLNDNLTWSSQMLGYSSRPPDPAIVGTRWRDIWLHRLQTMPLLAANWLRHQRRDGFWKHGSVGEDFSAIEAAVFAVGGWADAYSNAVPRLLAGLEGPALGLFGPWVHKYPHMAWPEPAIGFLQEMLRWWDHWLKGQDTGIMAEPAYRAYLLDSVAPAADHGHWPGRWIAEPAWPSPNTAPRHYALNPGCLEVQAAPETALSLRSPQTTGLQGGRCCPGMRQRMEFPTDQRGDDAGSLVFDSEPLAARVEILGAPAVELDIACDRPMALIAVRLCDLHPDGASARVTYGVLNLTHRESHGRPAPLTPGQRYRVRVQLNDIAYAFAPGHRIRLALSTAYWPLVWPSPEPVLLTLFTGASRLALPVRPERDAVAPTFDAPEAAPPLAREELRPAACTRTVERDPAGGAVTLRTLDDNGAWRIAAHGLEFGSRVAERFAIRDDGPLSARVETDWTFTVGRGDWQTRTESRAAMWSDRDSFYLEARLEAFDSDEPLFEKTWNEKIPRDLV